MLLFVSAMKTPPSPSGDAWYGLFRHARVAGPPGKTRGGSLKQLDICSSTRIRTIARIGTRKVSSNQNDRSIREDLSNEARAEFSDVVATPAFRPGVGMRHPLLTALTRSITHKPSGVRPTGELRRAAEHSGVRESGGSA